MKTYYYLSLALLSWPCLAVNLAAQATAPQNMTPERSIGANVEDSIAALGKAERIDDMETLLLGLKSEFLLVRKVAAVALSKKTHDDALGALVDAYEANQVYVAGGTENELLQRDTDTAITSAIDKILNPGQAHAGQYSKDETNFIVESAKRRLAKGAIGGKTSGGAEGPASGLNARESQTKPRATDTKASAPVEAQPIPLATSKPAIRIWTALGVLLTIGVFFWVRRTK